MLNNLKLHLYFFLLFIIILLLGLVFNISIIVWLLGALLALASDPIVLIAGVFVGLYFGKLKQILTAYLISAVIVNTIVSISTVSWHEELGLDTKDAIALHIIFIRSVALLYVIVLFNAIRIFIKKLFA